MSCWRHCTSSCSCVSSQLANSCKCHWRCQHAYLLVCVLLYRAITITAVDASGKAVKELCPGVEYTVTVKYPEARRTLLTTTQGAWANANATCPGRVYTERTGKAAQNFTSTVTIPCNTTGTSFGRCYSTGTGWDACWIHWRWQELVHGVVPYNLYAVVVVIRTVVCY